jgi:hypothetical protein
MKKVKILLIFLLPLFQAAAQQPDAKEIMEKSRDLAITGSMSANIALTITEKNGSVRKRTISMATKSYPDGAEKRMIKFLEPTDVKGTALLVIDNKNIADEMWIFLPALKKTRRIVSSERGKSFMSSEFANSDMSSPAIDDFTYKHMASSGENNQWIIESTPINTDKAEEYGYSRKLSYLDSKTWQVKKMEFYDFDYKLFKILEIRAILPLAGGKFIVRDMMATNHINGRSSEIRMDNVVTNINLDDSVFTIQNLEK